MKKLGDSTIFITVLLKSANFEKQKKMKEWKQRNANTDTLQKG